MHPRVVTLMCLNGKIHVACGRVGSGVCVCVTVSVRPCAHFIFLFIFYFRLRRKGEPQITAHAGPGARVCVASSTHRGLYIKSSTCSTVHGRPNGRIVRYSYASALALRSVSQRSHRASGAAPVPHTPTESARSFRQRTIYVCFRVDSRINQQQHHPIPTD